MIKKRAQAWGFDLMIAISIFLVGALLFFVYSLNIYENESAKATSMKYEAEQIGNMLLSEGFPASWNKSNVVKIGLLTENKVNETKISLFYELSESDYERTKTLFNTRYHYFFNLSEPILIGNTSVSGIGSVFVNQTDLVKITRFTIYKNKPVTANIYLWQ